MSTDLSLPRPGRLQARTWPRKRRKRRAHHGDPAPMNCNATAQMVTTTQRGCETDRDLKRKLDIAIAALREISQEAFLEGLAPYRKLADAALFKVVPYPLPCGRTK